jgi:2-polyprenyl-6-methoxyphenol hydroxylase-like FAD-dependent oxidoreductase
MNSTDVLVVGAGPTGLTLAAALTARGVATTLVDALPEGANTSRAAAVSARTLEVLEEIDVAERLVKNGIQARNFSIRDRNRVLIPLDFSALPTNYPYTLMISQADTEQLLLDRLEELGGEVVRPKRLTAVRQDSSGAVATFADGDEIQASYVVGADGMNSAVRSAAGIGFRGHVYAESFTLADVRLTGDVPVGEIQLFYARSGLVVVAPLPGDMYRIVAPAADPPRTPSRDFVQRILDARGFGPGRLAVEDVMWGSHFRIHHRVADTYRSGRLVLAGDAAHVHSPAGGQGMNLGIQDAVALADALGRVVGGQPEALLDEYSQARRPIAQQVLQLTGRLTRLATLPAAMRPARNTLMTLASHVPAVRRQLTWRLSGLVYR